MHNHSKYKLVPILFLMLFAINSAQSQQKTFKEVRRFEAPEARQGIAVDAKHIYVVGTQHIGKYEKDSGKRVASWQGEENGRIIHLDSGVIIDGKLYCSHSNYPTVPMTSSVEIWDAATLKHIGSHSFGIDWGSCTWVDRHDGFWWAAFAYYDKWKDVTGRGSEWTTLIKFNDQWQKLAGWVFPDSVVQLFRPMSNSGGSWGPDGLLYCTGHDRSELYAMRLPESGSILELVATIQIPIFGQGIAWDRTDEGVIYGIRKRDRTVVISRLVAE